MADPRSVMQEFRFLEQKRQAGPLTPAESARHAELRDLVGFEQPAPVRGGFDVTAAAAQLRESLLPAGLRSRPLDAPPPPAPAVVAPSFTPPPAPEPLPEPAFDAAPGADPLFDPASLGQEVRPQAWNPEAPGYHPDAPYDEAAWIAAGYDPTATYDWSAAGGVDPAETGDVAPALDADPGVAAAPFPDDAGQPETAPASGGELPPLSFGEYDAPGAPLDLGEPVEPEEPRPAPDGGADWFDGTAAIPDVPPLASPSFGEYDATPAPAAVFDAGGEPFYGGPEGDAIPGGTPLELGDGPSAWSPDGSLEGGFELASGGSFGAPSAPAQVAPWATPELAAPAEAWESAPALDLSTPFAAVPIPAAGAGQGDTQVEPLDGLEPEETLELVPETPEAAFDPAPSTALEPLPSEPGWPPADEPVQTLDLLEVEEEAEPVSLSELDAAMEIDVPPEIAAAYDAPSPVPALDFDAPPAPAPAVAGPAPVDPGPGAPPSLLAEPERATARAGRTVVAGSHRVVVHTLDGEVLRGTLTDCDLEAADLALDSGAATGPAAVASAGVKAIFFMLAPGEQPPSPQGRRVRVAFSDGRQVAGFSPDYHDGGVGFFMIPADTRTNTGRIWVYQAATRQVTVS